MGLEFEKLMVELSHCLALWEKPSVLAEALAHETDSARSSFLCLIIFVYVHKEGTFWIGYRGYSEQSHDTVCVCVLQYMPTT